MIANFETHKYIGTEQVWTGNYSNLRNLPHWHTDFELIHVTKGHTSVSINDQVFFLSEGQTLFVSGGEIHSIQSSENSVVSICLFDDNLVREINTKYSLASPSLIYSYPFNAVFRAIQEEFEQKQPFYELKSKHILQDLLLSIFRKEPLEEVCLENEHHTLKRYKELLNELDKNYVNMSFRDSAKFMGFSEAYFSRFFKLISGMTFSQYRNTIRVEKAIQLLRSNSNLTVSQISFECGFGTPRHFNRVFHAITGFAPTALPIDFRLSFHPQKAISLHFDPTLNGSVLLDKIS